MDSNEPDHLDSRSAEELFREFLRRREAGEPVDFESYCAEHPAAAHALRGLHSMRADSRGAPSQSASSQDSRGVLKTLNLSFDRSGVDIEQGTLLGHYRVESELGKGGFGVVYLARDEELDRNVAVKVLKAGMDSAEILTRFDSERHALAKMSHPGIARVYGSGVTDRGRSFFVMELVDGVPISSYCQDVGLTLRAALGLFCQVCDAVQHAHQRGVLHRDLKPSNVLVARNDRGEPECKVIDFGLAKALGHVLSDTAHRTEYGTILGTPEYMSPEQALGTGQDVDVRADVYSLGVILYELITGTLPISSEVVRSVPPHEIPRVILQTEPERPSDRLGSSSPGGKPADAGRPSSGLRARVRNELDWIVMKALSKNRERRYETAATLREDLERYLADEPVIARPPSVFYKARKFVRRRRTSVVAVALVTLVVVATVAGIWLRQEARYREIVRETGDAVSSGDLEKAQLTFALLERDFPAEPETATFRGEIESLKTEVERRARIRRSETLLAEGERQLERYRGLVDQFDTAHRRWEDAKNELEVARDERWAPVWERTVELGAWRDVESLALRIVQAFSEVTAPLYEAQRDSPPGSDLERAIRDRLSTFATTQIESRLRIQLPNVFRSVTPEVAAPTMTRVRIFSTPAGAEVYCLRYVEQGGILRPLALNLSTNDVFPGPLPVIVERVWPEATRPEDRAPFEPGDRVVSLDGREVASWRHFVKLLGDVGAQQEVQVEIEREGTIRRARWRPFPQDTYFARTVEALKKKGKAVPTGVVAGRLVNSYLQCGVTFQGYPLELRDENRVGVTESPVALEVDLPSGSYLLVFRAANGADVRLPFVLSEESGELSLDVAIPDDGEVPKGFVYIPAGQLSPGGDAKAYQPLDGDKRVVGGFFIGRYEVTLAEWREFLNDPELGEILPDGRLAGSGVRVVAEAVWQEDPDSDRWGYREGFLGSSPAFGISYDAALAYARWRTSKDPRWRYRLPDPYEWERAARGADGRLFAWGDYFIASSCLSNYGSLISRPHPVGSYSLDESPFGVRDVTGSVCENTEDWPVAGARYVAYRGGSFLIQDEWYFRLAGRHSQRPDRTNLSLGVRLVAEPK